MAHRNQLTFLLITVVFIAGVDNNSWKTASKKMVDIGIVMDQNPLDLHRDPDPSSDEWKFLDNLRLQSRDAMAKLVEDVIKVLLESRKSDVDAQFSIMFHERQVKLDQSFEQTASKSAEEIAQSLLHFNVNVFIDRLRHEEQSVANARKVLADAPGNRPAVPDLLLWISLYDTSQSSVQAIERLRDVADGPDLLVAAKNTEWAEGELKMTGNGINNVASPWNGSAPSQIADFILQILSTCTTEVQDGQDDPCYHRRENGPCATLKTYRPSAQNAPEKLRYCVNGTAEDPCDKKTCETRCEKEPKKTFDCSVTCGEGVKETRPKNYETDKLIRYCPPKIDSCDTGVKCPTTTQATTPNVIRIELELWHFLLIIVGALLIVLVIIFVSVYCCCLRKKKPTEKPKRSKGYGRMGKSHHRSRTGSQSHLGSRLSSRVSSQHRSQAPRYVEPSMTRPSRTKPSQSRSPRPSRRREAPKKKMDTRKTTGAYIDLSGDVGGDKPPGYVELEVKKKSGYIELGEIKKKQPEHYIEM